RESADLVKRTVTERGYTAPVLLDASGDVTGRGYGVFGPPTVYLVDREWRRARLVAGVGRHRDERPHQIAEAGARGRIGELAVLEVTGLEVHAGRHHQRPEPREHRAKLPVHP